MQQRWMYLSMLAGLRTVDDFSRAFNEEDSDWTVAFQYGMAVAGAFHIADLPEHPLLSKLVCGVRSSGGRPSSNAGRSGQQCSLV